MLTVYRIQQLSNYPAKAVALVEDILIAYSGTLGITREPNYIKRKWLTVRQDESRSIVGETEERLDQMVDTIDNVSRVINGTKDRFIFFLISNVLIIFLSLVLLPFCESLEHSGWKYFWTVILMILVVVSLYATIRLCLTLMETKWKGFWQRTKIDLKGYKDKFESWLIKH